MSDNVLIIIIVAVAVIIVLFMFRRQLKSFFMKFSKDGFETKLEANQSPAPDRSAKSSISRNKMVGTGNKIDVEAENPNVDDNLQLGKDQTIRARTDPATDTTEQ